MTRSIVTLHREIAHAERTLNKARYDELLTELATIRAATKIRGLISKHRSLLKNNRHSAERI